MAQMMLVNPKKRRKKATSRKSYRRRSTAKRRYRRNPVKMRGQLGKIINQSIMPAATAAAGAIGLDMVMGFLPIPANLKTGPIRHIVKAGGALAMGAIAANFVDRKTAELFASGAMTVVMYDAGKEMMQRFMPGVPMGAYVDDYLGYYGAGYNPTENNTEALGYYGDDDYSMDGLSIEEDLMI